MKASPSFAYLFERFPSFVQTFVYREAREMVRQGMDPWLVSIRRPSDPVHLAEEVGLETFYLPEADEMRAEIDALAASEGLPAAQRRAIAEWRKKPDSNRVFEAVWLGRELKGRKIHHVHAHFGGLAARTAWMIKKLWGITYSFTGHANDIFCENDFPITNTMLVRGARLVVTETDFARRWMDEKYPFARGKVARVFNGMETEGFPPREPSESPPCILSVGRFVEKKGFADLIEACRLLRSHGRQFECQIIGDGPLETNLQMRIERAGLQGVVKLLGARSQAEVRGALSAARVFALASVPENGGGSDNLPTVIMEAMLAGVPVVSTRVAGIPEMIDEGKNGFLVEPRDPAALAAALEKVLTGVQLGERLGAHGRAAARERFAIEKTTASLKQLLVERCRVRPPRKALELDHGLRVPSVWSRLWG